MILARSLLLFVCFNFLGFSTLVLAEDSTCDEALSEKVNDVEHWYNLQRIVHKSIDPKAKNPFAGKDFEVNEVGKVHKELRRIFPAYDRILQARSETLDGGEVSLEDYKSIKEEIESNLGEVIRNGSDLEKFAAHQSIVMMPSLEARLASEHKEVKTREDMNQDAKKEEESESKSEEEEVTVEQTLSPDHYEPTQTDLSEEGAKTKLVHWFEFTTEGGKNPISLLRQNIYDVITLHSLDASPGLRGLVSQQRVTQPVAKMIMRPDGAKVVEIAKPYGLRPAVGRHGAVTIKETSPGVYVAEFKGDHENYEVPMFRDSGVGLPPGGSPSHFTQAPQIDLKLWPQNIQDFVESHKGLAPKVVAESLTRFFQVEGGYLYYSKGDKIDESQLKSIKNKADRALAKGLPRAIAVTHSGAFNCDDAAFVATQILRQYFRIPTRYVNGRTVSGSKFIDGENHFINQSTSPGHAWIEVLLGNTWVPFDPTPKENQPDMQQSIKDDLEKLTEDSDRDNEVKDAESEKSDAEESPTNDVDTEEAEKAASSEPPESGEATDSEAQESEHEKLRELKSELLERLKDSGAGEFSRDYGHFLQAFHIMLVETYIERGNLAALLTGAQPVLEALGRTGHVKSELDKILEDLTLIDRAFDQECKEGFLKCVGTLKAHITQGQDLRAYKILGSLIGVLEKLSKVRDLRANESEQLKTLYEVRRSFLEFNHENAEAFQRVKDIFDSLPGDISRRMMLDEYHIDSLSPSDPGLLSLSNEILSGQAVRYAKLAGVREYADIYIKSATEYSMDEVMLLQRSVDPMKRNSIVIAKSPMELNRMILNPKPGEHLFAPLLRNEQFAVGPRETELIPNPKNPIDYKLSVVYVDVTGSMVAETPFGERSLLQSYILNAFVDMALSEVDRSGQNLHQLIVVPFGEDVGRPNPIRSSEDAAGFIADNLGKPTDDSARRTNIMATFQNFFQLVRAAQVEVENGGMIGRLRDANMVLFSDGGGNVDQKEIEDDLKGLPEDIRVHLNMIAIDQTNAALESLVKEGEGLEDAKPSYKHIDTEEANRLNQRVNDLVNPQDPYFSDVDKGLIRRSINPLLASVQAAHSSFITPTGAAELSALDRFIEYDNAKPTDLKDKRLFNKLRQFRDSLIGVQVERPYREALVTGIAHYYFSSCGRPPSHMTPNENNELKRLLRWARE